MKKYLIVVSILFFATSCQKNQAEVPVSPTKVFVTVSGTSDCVPKDVAPGSPVTMECELGLKDNQGGYYHLNLKNIQTNSSSGKNIEVSGNLTPSRGKYVNIKGTIDVLNIKDLAGDFETYSSTAYGFSVKYPNSFVSVGAKPDSVRNIVNTSACVTHSLFGTDDFFECLVYKETNSDKTNLSSAAVSFTILKAKNTKAKCLVFSKSDVENVKQRVAQIINGVSFATAQTSGAAAGNIYESHVYRTFLNNFCLEISGGIHSVNAANYDPPHQEFDSVKVWNDLEEVIGTFFLQK